MKRKKEIVVDFERYRGKQVVIYRGRVIADGRSSTQALKKAGEKFPNTPRSEFILLFVPKNPVFVYIAEL